MKAVRPYATGKEGRWKVRNIRLWDIGLTDLKAAAIQRSETVGNSARPESEVGRVVAETQYGTIESALEVTRMGVRWTSWTKPFRNEEVRSRLGNEWARAWNQQEIVCCARQLRKRPGSAG